MTRERRGLGTLLKRQVAREFPAEDVDAAVAVLDDMERRWSGVYGEPSPSLTIFYDVLIVAGGDVDRLRQIAEAALVDWRDVVLWAGDIRRGRRERRRERRAARWRRWIDRLRGRSDGGRPGSDT